MESCIVLCIVVLGGIGSIHGIVIAAFVLIAVPEVFRELQTTIPHAGFWRHHDLYDGGSSGRIDTRRPDENENYTKPTRQSPRSNDMAETLLELKDVHTYYGNIHALKGISCSVEKGNIVCLIGANGAGKSTTLLTIFANPRARKGTIIFKGEEIQKMRTEQIAARGVAQAPEGPSDISPHDRSGKPRNGCFPCETTRTASKRI